MKNVFTLKDNFQHKKNGKEANFFLKLKN